MAGLFDIAKAEVLSKVTIPMYFDSIIVPQLDGYYDLYPVNFESKPVVCCPLHDEDTPSFRYYEDTQSFFCFGCQKGGTVINLHMRYASRMNGTEVGYREAVFFLYDYFITGKNVSETQVIQTKIPEVKLNTEQDIVRLNLYRIDLEKSISFDKSIPDNVKMQLWEAIDKTDCLLSLNLVTADEVKAYLKRKVQELIH